MKTMTTKLLMLMCGMMIAQWAISQPVNDNCSTATSLDTLPRPAACTGGGINYGTTIRLPGQTTAGGTPSSPYIYDGDCSPDLAHLPSDVWYSFIASGYQATIQVSAAFANPMISVYEGSCDTMLSIACASGGAADSVQLTVYNLTIGHKYYIQVSGHDSSQSGIFTLLARNDNNCGDCLVQSTLTVSPPPVNGAYAPGQRVTFAFTVTNWDQINANWFHGMSPSFGGGWDLSTLTPGTAPASCSRDGGHWEWHTADTSSATLFIYPAGFYYETSYGNSNNAINNNPGDNYGDQDSAGCTWQFTVSITTGTNIDSAADLIAAFSTSADGESGSWSSVSCGGDEAVQFYAHGGGTTPCYSQDTIGYVSLGGDKYLFTARTSSATPSLLWSDNASSFYTRASTDTLTLVLTPGVHSIAEYNLGCGTKDSISINVSACFINFNYINYGTIGSDDTVGVISLGFPPMTYNWSNGAHTRIDTVSASGNYCVTVTDATGCRAIVCDSVAMGGGCYSQDTIGYVSLGGDKYLFTARTSSATPSLLWSDNASSFYTRAGTDTLTLVLTPGVHSIAEYNLGCGTKDSISINVSACFINFNYINYGTIGSDDTVGVISLGFPPMTYNWSNGAHTRIDTVSASGNYCVTVTDATGCRAIVCDSVWIGPVSAGPDQTICLGSTARMAATGTGIWSALASNPNPATIDSPSSPVTTISNFLNVRTYGFVWTTAGGADMMMVTVDSLVQVRAGYNCSQAAICAGAPDTFTAVVINGGPSPTYQWYLNGSIVGANSPTYISPSLSNNDSVWLTVISDIVATCAPPNNRSTSLTFYAIVNPIPSAPVLSVAGTCLGSDSLELKGMYSGTQAYWYRNGTLADSSTVEILTVAGGNGQGNNTTQLTNPNDVFLDRNGYIYVSDAMNNRVQKFPPGSTSATNGVTVAGGNGIGTAANQFSNPQGIFVDTNGNLYVADQLNNRIQKFPAGSTSATNGQTIAHQNLSLPNAVCGDAGGNIYVSNGNYGEIVKFPAGSDSSTVGTLVAGSLSSGQFAPFGVWVDAVGNIYTSDVLNDRILKFPPGSDSTTIGLTVAGGNGEGNGANQLHFPNGVFVDSIGNIYVADTWNNRVQKFPPGSDSSTNGVTVAGGYAYSLIAAGQLGWTTGVFVDGKGDIYVTDQNNNRIQEWTNGPGVYTPAVAGSYTAAYISAVGCTSLLSDTVIISACMDTVWPGDADANHLVDNNDLLTIGLGYDSTGPVRTVQGNVWQGDLAADWDHNFTIYAPTVNFNNADCDGNGTINADDTLAIVTNWGLTHAKTNGYVNSWRSGIPALNVKLFNDTTYAGDTLTAKFYLGDSTLMASNVYGLAFTYHYDPTVMDTNTISFGFIPSWLGDNTNSINIYKDFKSTGTIQAAITGIDHVARSGWGQIATFRCIITTDNINGKDYSYYNDVAYFTDITAIDQHGNPITLNAGIDSNLVGYYPNGIKEPTANAHINIYPNPAATIVLINTNININGIMISDMLGQTVLEQKGNNKQSEAIDISGLAAGVYTVHASATNGSGTAKLIISR